MDMRIREEEADMELMEELIDVGLNPNDRTQTVRIGKSLTQEIQQQFV